MRASTHTHTKGPVRWSGLRLISRLNIKDWWPYLVIRWGPVGEREVNSIDAGW